MGTQPEPSSTPRTPLNRERVVRAAVALADEAGLEALSMRRLGQRLGVEAMSLYNHVANKDDLLDGMIDVVFSEIDLPAERCRLAARPCASGRPRCARPSRATPGRPG